VTFFRPKVAQEYAITSKRYTR